MSDPRVDSALQLSRAGRFNEAAQICADILRAEPRHFEALHALGLLHSGAGRLEEAALLFGQALAANPLLSRVWHERGNVLLQLGRFAEARASFDRVLALDPRYTLAWIGRSLANFQLREFSAALSDADNAGALDPHRSEAWECRGNALMELGRLEDAMQSYDRAIAHHPRTTDALYNRGLAAMQLRRYGDAIRDFSARLAAVPHDPHAGGDLLYCRLCGCDWRGLDALQRQLTRALGEGRRSVNPFAALMLGNPAHPDPAADRAAFRAAQLTSSIQYPPQQPMAPAGSQYAHSKIRVAYLSADLHTHATAFLTAPLFEHHDRSRFEVFGFSYGPDDGSPMRARLAKAFTHFFDVSTASDRDIARMLREHEIDIAVDLKGHTSGARPGILAFRPAPVQAHYLGFPGSVGASYIDYLIADRIVVPPEHAGRYSERIVYLPESYQCNDGARAIGPLPSHKDAELPDGAFVFASFSSSYKIAPAIFDVWMRLLRQVDGSVFWLLDSGDMACANLRHEAKKRGVDPKRLVFAPKAAQEDHLARHALADLCLDTLPVCAHTTASDALFAGLPIVTCIGPHFVGRVAASVLHAAGLPELVTQSLAEYEALALRLAHDRGALTALKSKVAEARTHAPLFDVGRFTRHLESAYTTMWERNARNEAPQSFTVPAAGSA